MSLGASVTMKVPITRQETTMFDSFFDIHDEIRVGELDAAAPASAAYYNGIALAYQFTRG